MKKIFGIAIIASLVALLSCSKKEDSSEGTSSNFTSVAASRMAAVSAGYSPGSLSSSGVSVMSDNPCAGTNGLIDCQPNLLKLYLGISKQMFDITQQMITSVGGALGDLQDGSSGQTTNSEGQIIVYSKTSASVWSVWLKTGSGVPVAYFASADNVYTLEFDAAQAEDGSVGKFASTLTYTSDDTWSMTSTIAGAACRDEDARAPQNISIVMKRAGQMWTGKTMMYLPRWAKNGNPVCSDSVTDAIATNIYSDFVGDNSAAKMSVYMLKRTRAANEIASHPISDMCNEFNLCTSGQLGSETLANYPNPVCIPATTGDATWNSDCTGVSGASTVQAASFGPASDWVAPTDFHQIAIDVGP